MAELLKLYTRADSESWSTLPEIALRLAQARVNATVGAGPTECQEQMDKLLVLYTCATCFWSTLPEIALQLAKFFFRFNATVGAALTECQEQVDKLLVLYTRADYASWSTLPEIALELAKARFNATVVAPLTRASGASG